MKKYEGVLARVRELEYKRGIKYANTDSRIYKVFKVLYILMLIWTTATNLLFVLGHLLMYSSGTGLDTAELKNRIIGVSVCGVLLIAGAVLNRFRLYIVSAAVSLVSAVVLILQLGKISTDDFGFLGFKPMFYFRHFIPAVLLLVFLGVLTLIAVRANIKTDRMYKKVTENLYNMYNVSDAAAGSLTDEQWDEFLKNYNPYNKSKITEPDKDKDDEGQ